MAKKKNNAKKYKEVFAEYEAFLAQLVMAKVETLIMEEVERQVGALPEVEDDEEGDIEIEIDQSEVEELTRSILPEVVNDYCQEAVNNVMDRFNAGDLSKEDYNIHMECLSALHEEANKKANNGKS